MPSTSTTYTPTGVQNTAQGGYGFDPNQMGGMDLGGAARFAQQMALQQMAMRDRQMQMQEQGFRNSQEDRLRGMQQNETDRNRARQMQLDAMRPKGGPPGPGNYYKIISSPGVTPGYARTSGGDPGAIFGGYGGGQDPRQASFSAPNPAPTAVNMGGDRVGQPIQQSQGEDSLGDIASRYFKQFGDIPEWAKDNRRRQ